jgi:hypothetical protein
MSDEETVILRPSSSFASTALLNLHVSQQEEAYNDKFPYVNDQLVYPKQRKKKAGYRVKEGERVMTLHWDLFKRLPDAGISGETIH